MCGPPTEIKMPTRLPEYRAGNTADNGHAIYPQDKTMYTMASPGILTKASPEVSSSQPCAAQVCPFSLPSWHLMKNLGLKLEELEGSSHLSITYILLCILDSSYIY